LEEGVMKSKLRTWSIALAAFALVAEGALGGELFSVSITAQEGQTLACSAVNVGRKNTQMHIDLFEGTEYTGEKGDPGTSFPPGGSTGASHAGPITAFCRVTFSGNKKNVRAHIQVSEDGVPLVAVPVQ
jgi:hypothetical protein